MLEDLIFVGFNSRVAALHRDDGRVVWHWMSPKGSGYTTVLLDDDRLIVSVIGYTYCLDPLTGQQYWVNELSGMGAGVASLASARGSAGNIQEAAADEAGRRRAAASAGGQ